MEPPESGARHDEILDRYWDDVVLGLAGATAEIDAADVAAIERLHRDVRLPGPDAAFRRRLRRDLMRARALPVSSEPRSFSLQQTWRPGTSRPRDRGSWWLAQAATVLLLAAVAFLFVAFNAMRPHEPAATVPAVAAPSATLAATPAAVASPRPEATGPVAYRWQYSDPDHVSLALSPQLTVAPDGNLWVADGARMDFQIFSPEGKLLERWGAPGAGDGQFNFRRDAQNAVGSVAFRPDGGFYVADSHNYRIQQFDARRQFVRAWGRFGDGPGQFREPWQVLVDAAGDVTVIDDKRDDVQQFDPNGKFLRQFGGHGAADGQFNGAGAGAFDAAGNLWLADGADRVQEFAPDGTFLRSIGRKGSGNGEFDGPQGLAIDASGRLYVADSGNNRVQVFDRDGRFLVAFDGANAGGAPFDWPVAVAVSRQGDVFVLEYHTEEKGHERVQVFRLTSSPVS